jgi:hypothetical protein
MSKGSRTDLCGGWPERAIPTATVGVFLSLPRRGRRDVCRLVQNNANHSRGGGVFLTKLV